MRQSLGTAGFSRFAAITALLLCQAAAAWESLPLREPAPARSVVAEGRVLFVCGDDSLRTSGDGGETWQAISSIPGSGPMTAFWAGTGYFLAARAHAVYRSSDAGATWGKAGGDSIVYAGLRFLTWKDTLMMLTSLFWPYTRMYSLDSGLTWRDGSPWNEDPGSITNILGPGPQGKSTGSASLMGNLYVTTETGALMRQSAGGRWIYLSPGTRPASPSALVAAGRNLCMATELGISCSRDGGSHFAVVASDTIYTGGPTMAVDQDHLYVNCPCNYTQSPIWSRELGDTAAWIATPNPGWPSFSSKGSPMAARPGLLLIVMSGWRSFLSMDQGAKFTAKSETPPISMNKVSMGKRFWAAEWRTSLYLSSDSGNRWSHRVGPAIRAFGVSDSSLFSLGLDGVIRQSSLNDSAWKIVPAPSADTLLTLTAADSVLYAAEPGKLWIRNLYATPTALPGRPAKAAVRSSPAGFRAGFSPPGGGPIRDALGKRAVPDRPLPVRPEE